MTKICGFEKIEVAIENDLLIIRQGQGTEEKDEMSICIPTTFANALIKVIREELTQNEKGHPSSTGSARVKY